MTVSRVGVIALDARNNSTEEFSCDHLLLATGGCGQLYRVSTNPPVATADGVAVGYRAGAEVTDMEFIQFHPTALRLPGVPVFLISEAVRGEGALLVNVNGERFMPNYDERAELAPRDVVARAILSEMQRTESDRVYLDVTHLPPGQTAARFPQIMRYCAQNGLDITKERIPVSPAAHYMMGGVKTNAWGETNVRNLYAAGETACTGVHGANRLASNSLLETIVFAKRVINRTLDPDRRPTSPDRADIRLPDTLSEAHKSAIYNPEGIAMPRVGAPARALPFAEQGLSLVEPADPDVGEGRYRARRRRAGRSGADPRVVAAQHARAQRPPVPGAGEPAGRRHASPRKPPSSARRVAAPTTAPISPSRTTPGSSTSSSARMRSGRY